MAQDPEFEDLDGKPDDEIQVGSPERPDANPNLDDYRAPTQKGDDDIAVELEPGAMDATVADVDRGAEVAQRDDDADGEWTPAKIRKRVQREIRLKEQARAEAAAERSAREKAERELAEITKKLAEQDAESKIREAKKRMEDARISEDRDAEAEAMADYAAAKAKKEMIASMPVKKPEPKPAEASPDGDNDALQDWMDRNRHWFDKPEFYTQSRAAEAISERLIREGKDPTDSKFYELVDRELSRTVKIPSGAVKRSQPVSGVRDGAESEAGQRVASGARRVTITAEDVAMMRRLKLDPNDPKVLKDWAREKAANSKRAA